MATTTYCLAPVPGLARIAAPGQRRGRFPRALDEVVAAYHEARAISGGDILLGGASAGACLAAAATLRALDEKAGPSGVVLAYGFFHATHPRVRDSRHRSRHHRRFTHATWALNVMNRNYAGSPEALGDRLAFPGGHDVAGFPRTLIINVERDNMRASGDLFASELRTSGVDLHHHVAPGTTHAFLNRPGLPPFLTATDMIAKWIAAPSV